MANLSDFSGLRHAKPLAKCVDVKCIREWVPEEARRRVDISPAWTIIKNHYCAALVGRGVCPIECETCRDAITSMFGLEEAKNPEALLTWRAKDRSAAMIEDLIAAQKREDMVSLAQYSHFPALETRDRSSDYPLASLFPKKKVDNLFLEMEKDYG